MKLATLTLLLVALPTLGEPISLKGLRAGMTKSQLEEAHPGLTAKCLAMPDSPDTEVCAYPFFGAPRIDALDTFAGAKVERWMAIVRDGVAHTISVTMASREFERVRAALEVRLGKPKSSTDSVAHNRMGAAFDQAIVDWLIDGSYLLMRKRARFC